MEETRQKAGRLGKTVGGPRSKQGNQDRSSLGRKMSDAPAEVFCIRAELKPVYGWHELVDTQSLTPTDILSSKSFRLRLTRRGSSEQHYCVNPGLPHSVYN